MSKEAGSLTKYYKTGQEEDGYKGTRQTIKILKMPIKMSIKKSYGSLSKTF